MTKDLKMSIKKTHYISKLIFSKDAKATQLKRKNTFLKKKKSAEKVVS